MAEPLDSILELTVTEMWSPQAQESDTSGRVGRSRRRRGFQVTGPRTTTTADIIAHASIPKQDTPDPLNAFRLCRSVTVTRVAPILWLVIAEYEAEYVKGLGTGGGGNDLDILATEPRYRGGFTRSTEYVDIDLGGGSGGEPQPYQNVNAEPFDPPVQREILDPAIWIERYEADVPFSASLLYADTTNALPMTLNGVPIPKGAGLLYDISYADEIHADQNGAKQRYWRVTYEFRFRVSVAEGTPDGKAWWRRVKNMGFMRRTASQVTPPALYRLIPIMDEGDPDADPPVAPSRLIEPVNLSAAGQPLDFTNPAQPIHWLYFKEHREADWTPLGLFV